MHIFKLAYFYYRLSLYYQIFAIEIENSYKLIRGR